MFLQLRNKRIVMRKTISWSWTLKLWFSKSFQIIQQDYLLNLISYSISAQKQFFSTMLKCTFKEFIIKRSCIQIFRRVWNLQRHVFTQHSISINSFRDDQNATQNVVSAFINFTNQNFFMQVLIALIVQHFETKNENTQFRKTSRCHDFFAIAFEKTSNAFAISFMISKVISNLEIRCSHSRIIQKAFVFDQILSIDDDESFCDQSTFFCKQVKQFAIFFDVLNCEISNCFSSCENTKSDNSIQIRKRKRSIIEYDKINLFQTISSLFIYDVRMSTKMSNQIKRLNWLSDVAKHVFDDFYKHWLAKWDVKTTHTDTCVLIFENWRNFDSMKLLKLFDVDNCSTTQTSRLRYQYENHVIVYAKTLIWFVEWSKSFAHLNNFINVDFYQFMNVSHIYHHDFCIVHLIYEAICVLLCWFFFELRITDCNWRQSERIMLTLMLSQTHINQFRKVCYEFVKKLKREKKFISKHCDKHDSSCLFQISVLTSFHTMIFHLQTVNMFQSSWMKFYAYNLMFFVKRKNSIVNARACNDRDVIRSNFLKVCFLVVIRLSLSTQSTWFMFNQQVEKSKKNRNFFVFFASASSFLTMSATFEII